MSVGLLLITHEGIAQSLLHTARKMLGVCPLSTQLLEVPLDSNPQKILQQGQSLIQSLDQHNGVLILTDLYGSTPSNIGHQLLDQPETKMVAGINLPMLVRVLNYPQLNLHDMALKAVSGGHDGVILCDCK